MNSIIRTFSISILSIGILLQPACIGNKNKNNKITIAAAANMQYAIDEIAELYTQNTGVECQLVISSSGKITAQIKEGAPYDVFLSADMKYPMQLYKDGHAVSKPKVYALGNMVIWTLKDNVEPSFESLESDQVKHIAIANPKTAPYGAAAIEILNHNHLLGRVEHKLVYGESISQTNQFIISKSAEIGFTAKSIVVAPEMIGKGKWKSISKEDYSPIQQGAIVINHNNANSSASQNFYNFLFSNQAKQILTKFGFSVDE